MADQASVLDNPAWASLVGPHAPVARVSGRARAYDPAVSPFVGVEAADAWDDLRELVGPAGTGAIAGWPLPLPDSWTREWSVDGFRMVAVAPLGAVDSDAVLLGDEDAADMLDLATRTRPGPFLLRTGELGRFRGIRDGGRLIAMAGERMHPPGHVEVSAVCTDPEFRGRGFAERLMRDVAADIEDRGEIPFLHVAGVNQGAIRLYERIGFRVHTAVTFVGFRAPA